MTQEMDASANQMFEEFSSEIYNSALHSSQHEVEDREEILDVTNLDTEKYHLVFPSFADDGNEIIVNCGKQFQQFNSEMYAIHMPETNPKMTDSGLIFIHEATNVGIPENTENLNPTHLFSTDNTHNNEESNLETSMCSQQYFQVSQSQNIEPSTQVTDGCSVTEEPGDCRVSAVSAQLLATKETVVTEDNFISEDTSIRNKFEAVNEKDVDDPCFPDNSNHAHQDATEQTDNVASEMSRVLISPRVLNMVIEVTEKNIFALHGIDISLPISCDVCNIDFSDMKLFDDHMRSHVENRLFMCQLCPKSYVSWENLVAHRKAVHEGQFISCKNCSCRKHHQNLGPLRFPIGEFPSGCEECDVGFSSSSQLNKHFRCHAPGGSEKEKTKQSKVKKVIKSPSATNSKVKGKDNRKAVPSTSGTHVQAKVKATIFKSNRPTKELTASDTLESDHKSEVRYKCPQCSSSFKDFISYKVHKVTHEKKSVIYSCQICSKEFSNKELCDSHKCSHLVEEYYCFNCQLDFCTPSDMQRHIERVHYRRPDVKLTCNVCSFNYAANHLMNHYLICFRNKKSKGESTFVCHICEEVYYNSIDLQEHVKTHSSDTQSSMCEICGILLHDKYMFSKHLRSHSPNRKNSDTETLGSRKGLSGEFDTRSENVVSYVCEYCGRKFKNMINLGLHVRRHTGEKPYECTYCSKAFYTGPQLSVHVRQHTGERPYNCSVCKKSFSSSTTLSAHKKVHANGPQYTCSVCSKNFLWHSAYQNHMRIHSNIRPYKCEICSKAFLFKNGLTAHLKRHEEGKLYNFDFVVNKPISLPLRYQCSDCGQSFSSNQELENHHEEKCYLTMITFSS